MNLGGLPTFVIDKRQKALQIQRQYAPDWNWQTRPRERIAGIDVHHAAGNASAETIVARAAQRGAEFYGVPLGYHIVIEASGSVNLVADLESVVYHNAGGGPSGRGWSVANDTRIGVCFSGNFAEELAGPNEAQVTGFRQLWRFLLEEGVPNSLKGHKEWRATACPGTNWSQWRDKLLPRPATGNEWNDALDAALDAVIKAFAELKR